MSEIEKKWYVLRAISGKEAKVKEYLDVDIKNSGLSDFVSQVLIPTEKVYQVRNGKKIVKERSYLPGYVLVEAALVGEVAHPRQGLWLLRRRYAECYAWTLR